ncbi:dystrophin-like [Anastrepha ludens]|uniref:dystrophin-like n=1 Tax=Anastrepha ludens TaxID=28586 RepID=UPI0023AF706E|nr:dystrophin-like [Anastrepha ludens]
MNGGFRITGYPAAAAATTAASSAGTTTTPGTTLTACNNTPSNSAMMHNATGNTNKINNDVASQGICGNNNTFANHFNPLRTPNGSIASQQSQAQQQKQQMQLKQLQLQREQRERALDLHISEYQPPTPTQFTTVAPPLCGNTAAPIALKGNNPFLNSPSPTDTMPTAAMAFGYAATTTTTMTSAMPLVCGNTNNVATPPNTSGYEMPEYAEPQRFRAHKQPRPHSIAVASMSASMSATTAANVTTTSTSGATSYSSSTNDLAFSTLRRTPKALPNSFVDYASRHQLQQEEQLRLQHVNLQQQQQRLLQSTRQQQQLRSVGAGGSGSGSGLSNSGTPVSIGTAPTSAGTPTPATSVDKEALYAALFQHYRNSPTRAPHATLPHKMGAANVSQTLATHTISSAVSSSAATTTNYCPPVPLHRNQNSTSAAQQLHHQQQASNSLMQQPIVPRRSHSTPRPLKGLNDQQPQSPQQPLPPAVNGGLQLNGGTAPRPRSLDRFNSEAKPAGLYQPPPIPLRRFPPGVTNSRQSMGSPQPDSGSDTPKFSGKKSTSIDNIRNGLSFTSASDVSAFANGAGLISSATGGMRHSVTFHGRSQSGQISAEHGFNGDVTAATVSSAATALGITNLTSSASWQKGERPLSYAYGASAPDQAYLENQLRAYSEQLRTITESVRKYSEQAKLLSELKRQQQLAKVQQLQPTSGNISSPTMGGNITGNAQQSLHVSSSQSGSNFSSNMISPEIVSKSLASLCSSTEAQTPSHQLRLFLDNIRSTMRSEYQQNIPEDMLKPITESKSPTSLQQQLVQQQPQSQIPHSQASAQLPSLMAYKRPNLDESLRSSPVQSTSAINSSNSVANKSNDNDLPTPSDQLRLFLDAIRSNKIPETDEKPKLANSQTLDSFISKPLQMPDVTSGTPGAQLSGMPPTRRRPKSAIATTKIENDRGEHSMITSESFHQISDNLRLMSEDLKALSPSKVLSSSVSSGNLKVAAATVTSLSPSLTSELRVITSHSPLSTSPINQSSSHYATLSRANVSNFGASSAVFGAQITTNSPSPSQSTHSQSTSATTTPSTAPLMTDFNAILDSFHEMADKYKSKGSYDYLRKCSDALRQHSQQLKLREQQQQMANGGGGFMGSDDSSSCSTTPGSIREAVQNLLMQPRNGFQILDDRMRLFIDIIDSQDRLSQFYKLSNDIA